MLTTLLFIVQLLGACAPNHNRALPSTWDETLVINGRFSVDISAQVKYNSGAHYVYEIALSTIDPTLRDRIVQQFDSNLSLVFNDTITTGFFLDELDNQVEIECYLDYLYLQKGESGTVQLEDWVLAGDAYPGEPVGTKLENVLITCEEAVAAADSFLRGAEINDFVFAEAKKCRILTDEYETVCEGWYVTYLRDYNDYVPFDYFLYELYGPIRLQYTKHTAPWMQEQLSFVFTENGCQVFQWNAPTKVLSQQSVGGNFADFKTIQNTIRREIKNGYAWCKSALNEDEVPYLYELRLTWAMMHSKTNKEAAIISPMWVSIFMSPKYEREHMRPFVICIDAITGKRIDPLFIN